MLTRCVICCSSLMLTERTSNPATAATFLPIAGAVAGSIGQVIHRESGNPASAA